MCWFLCANPIVNQWLHQPVDDAYRKAQALKPLLAADLLDADSGLETDDAPSGARVAASTGARTRTKLHAEMLISRRIDVPSWRVSSQLRNKPLELLAHAWSRFLLWLGCH